MEKVTMSDLHELVSARSDHCVSMFMPTQSAGLDGQQDAVRLKNLATRTEEQLIERGLRSPLRANSSNQSWKCRAMSTRGRAASRAWRCSVRRVRSKQFA